MSVQRGGGYRDRASAAQIVPEPVQLAASVKVFQSDARLGPHQGRIPASGLGRVSTFAPCRQPNRPHEVRGSGRTRSRPWAWFGQLPPDLVIRAAAEGRICVGSVQGNLAETSANTAVQTWAQTHAHDQRFTTPLSVPRQLQTSSAATIAVTGSGTE